MKSISVIFLLYCLNLSAQVNLGKELQVSVKPDGGYQLGVHYSYDADMAGDEFKVTWGILFGTNISQQELSALPAQLKWNIYSLKTGNFIFDWSTQPTISKNQIFLGSVSAEKKYAKQIIGNQTNTVLVFSDLNNNILYNLSIGKLCANLPTYFSNLTQPEKGCSRVSEGDIDSVMNGFCADKESELLGYVKDGLLRCEVAAKKFDSIGCGILNCK
jgi:hypothetical protein